MKRKNDLINRIRSLVTELSAQKTRLEVEDSIVEWSGELQVGTELSAVEGTLPETFSLDNGNVVTVEDGKVIGLTELTETEDEAEEEVQLETAEEEVDENEEVQLDENDEEKEYDEDEDEVVEEDDIEHRVATMEGLVDALVERISVLEGMIEEMNGMKKDQEELKSQLQELAKAPAVPAKKTEVSNNFNKTESRAAKIFASA